MSNRKVEEPVTVDDGRDGTKTTHPSFAQIHASRISGHSVLYASDFIHHAFIRIRIAASELMRSLSHDHYFSAAEYVEVDLSEAQWATFVSSLNMGGGTPCTLRYLGRKEIAELPAPEDRSKQFAGEVAQDASECINNLEILLGRIDEMKLPKGKTEELKKSIQRSINKLTSSMPFVAKSFGEHVERTVEKAKTEIHGYALGVITRTGIAALGGTVPLTLEDKTSGEKNGESHG